MTRNYREQLGVSRKTLASILGVSKSAVRDWEQGQREPPTIALNFCELLLNLNGSHLINRIKKEHHGRSTSKIRCETNGEKQKTATLFSRT